MYWSPNGTETVLHVGTHKNPDHAIAINNSGNSIGINSTETIAYEWSKAGKTVVLDKLPGTATDLIQPKAINDRGTVVGDEYNYNSQWTAVGWGKTGNVVNLQAILGPSWTDTVATGINDAGDICGWGSYSGSVQSAWELLRVPNGESPGTYINADNHANVLAASALTHIEQGSSGRSWH